MSSNSHSPTLCTVHCKPDLLSVPIYNGLTIMLLENREKSNGFVNGQLCTVNSVQGATVLPHDPHGHIINIYPVTTYTATSTYDLLCPTSTYYPFHPADAFAANLHAYVDTVLPSLCCSMDVQTSDGHAMILRYVISYVSKWNKTFHNDSLFVTDVNASHAAFRYLINLHICEPEMWSLLLNTKLLYCYGTTAKFVVPHPNSVVGHTVVQQNYRRPSIDHHLSLFLWCRNYHMSAKKSRLSHLPVLIGIQILSLFNTIYFFQLFLLHFLHTALDAILPDQSHSQVVPQQILYFQQAMHLTPHMFHPYVFQSTLRLKDTNPPISKPHCPSSRL